MRPLDLQRRNRFSVVLGAAGITAVSIAVYRPALAGGWLWDDGLEVAGNTSLRTLAGLTAIWKGKAGQDFFPLKDTLLWLQWHLWGGWVTGYHVVNLGFHVLCALLLWRVLFQLGIGRSLRGPGDSGDRSPAIALLPAWLGAMLFAVHPLAVESVAWVAEFKNPLSLALLLLAADRFLHFANGGASRRSYCWSLAWFGAAMLAKSSVIMFPLMQLLYARWRRGTVGRTDLRSAAPFFAISLTLGLTTIWFQQHRAMAGAPFPDEGLWSRIAAAGLAVPTYLFHCVFPFGLMPIYPRWNVAAPTLVQFAPWLLMAMAALGCRSWKSRTGRAVAFGLGCFFLGLTPVLGLVPMAFQRLAWIADHWAYVSLMSYCGLAAAGLAAAKPWLRNWLAGASVPLLLLFAWESRRLAAVYRNPETLWTYELARNPLAWSAEYDLGTHLVAAGRMTEGTTHLRKAVQLRPEYVPAQLNLANALTFQGEFLEGLIHYRQALALQPAAPEIHYNFGNALWRMRRRDEAIAEYRQALRLRPDYPDAQANLQRALGFGRSAR